MSNFTVNYDQTRISSAYFVMILDAFGFIQFTFTIVIDHSFFGPFQA